MMGKIDLHIHTGYSADGELTPHQIIALSQKLGMTAISITDHNSVRGSREALQPASESQIEIIPGIEIDCSFQSVDLHVLGYHIDLRKMEFDELERNLTEQGHAAFPKMISNLERIGIPVDAAEVLNAARGKIVTGELIGEVVLNGEESTKNEMLRPYLTGGARSDNPYLNFYLDFFAQGKAAYVPIEYMELREAVSLITTSGGVPVLAHPGNNLRHHLNLLDAIIDEGVMGIEVFSSYHTLEQTDYFLMEAERHRAIVTCGSDFHGKNKPSIAIGDCYCSGDERSVVESLRNAFRLPPNSRM